MKKIAALAFVCLLFAAGWNDAHASGVSFPSNYHADSVAITGGTINNTVIGNSTPAAGNFTTINATGAITPNETWGIVGTTTNNTAAAGSIGESSGVVGTGGTAMTSGVILNLASKTIPAGDFEVWGVVTIVPAATTNFTYETAGISTSATAFLDEFANGEVASNTHAAFVPTAAHNIVLNIPRRRLLLASPTTYYLNVVAGFTVSTATSGYYRITYRRIR